ncbi:MAG TPA: ATP-binding protein [Thermoanaerobaculia bacterium]|nr:ATP-binding protein [Thermoanaerobaculia bacterium]HPA95989.1 ATP-binding protein [Thermoanaerobaculia bacterium]
MKQLVVLSGKGGTGKTCLTAAFAHLAATGPWAEQVVLADADVDAANLELMLRPRLLAAEEFQGGKVARIDPAACTACGICETVCRFEAIVAHDGRFAVDPIACEGCAACVHHCPEGAISMHPELAGHLYHSESRYGPLHHAGLLPGQENSGKLVALVRQRARGQALAERRELVLVDGPPGIGCPVISAVTGADLALVVAEPSVSGAHDLNRTLDTLAHFRVRALVAVNRADLRPAASDEIEARCRERGVATVGRVPFDLAVARAMVAGEPVTANEPEAAASRALREVWERVSVVLRGAA